MYFGSNIFPAENDTVFTSTALSASKSPTFLSCETLGIPVHSADAFEMLELDGAISKELCTRLVGMTGFCNIAVHEYQKIDMVIVRSILQNRLDDLLEISAIALKGK